MDLDKQTQRQPLDLQLRLQLPLAPLPLPLVMAGLVLQHLPHLVLEASAPLLPHPLALEVPLGLLLLPPRHLARPVALALLQQRRLPLEHRLQHHLVVCLARHQHPRVACLVRQLLPLVQVLVPLVLALAGGDLERLLPPHQPLVVVPHLALPLRHHPQDYLGLPLRHRVVLLVRVLDQQLAPSELRHPPRREVCSALPPRLQLPRLVLQLLP